MASGFYSSMSRVYGAAHAVSHYHCRFLRLSPRALSLTSQIRHEIMESIVASVLLLGSEFCLNSRVNGSVTPKIHMDTESKHVVA